MELLNLGSILITLAALFAYVNYRYIKLPTTIGVMLISLIFSLVLIAIGATGVSDLDEMARDLLSGVDFNTTLLHGMLSFLLFAGALHININDLAQQKWVIATLATIGVIMSTVIVGSVMWVVFGIVGLEIPLLYCFLFGALISPTDPIAVLAILKTVGIAKSLETKIAGESLFNDGVGVVVFLVLFGLAQSPDTVSWGEAAFLFAQEAVGGVVLGLLLGLIAYRLLRSIDNYQVEILITLALVMGGYALARVLHTSGPIAIVVAGLCVGNHGRMLAMSDKTREHLDTFWELVDEILNALLFVLIGLEVLILQFTQHYLVAGLLAIPVVLISRLISVGVPVSVLRLRQRLSPHAVKLLVWGGLRGGISVALALSLPPGPARGVIVAVTYVIVIFSITVQGLTIGKLVKSVSASEP